MKLSNITNAAKTLASKAQFAGKKHGPEILVATGIVSGVCATVMACKATLKVNEVLAETKDTLEKVEQCSNDPSMAEKYTAEDAKKDTRIVYIQTGVKLAKLYGPALAFGAASLTCVLVAHKMLRERNLALAAAYGALSTSFKDYRSRVVDRFGEAVEKELRYNVQQKKVEEKITDEKGKEKTVKKDISVSENMPSPYARFFDESCPDYERNPEFNLMFLRSQCEYANNLLHTRGHLFLNEVYDMLGMKRTKEGQSIGWIYAPKKGFDTYVDFGIYDTHRYNADKLRDFVNGYEPSILLDFNVNGPILDMI